MLAFILAIGAGWATPYVQPLVGKIAASIFEGENPLSEGELSTTTLILLLLTVAILAALGNTNAGAFGVLLGGAIGFYGMRIIAMIRSFTSDHGSDD